MTGFDLRFVTPGSPAHPRVRALSTERTGGVSGGAYASLNLGIHGADQAKNVAENRRRLIAAADSPEPVWLQQVHGAAIAELGVTTTDEPRADGAVTSGRRSACAVLTADCLPVLFCDRRATRVGAAHAGWRGLAGGVLEAAVERLALPPEELLAWLGPCIGPSAFEVGPEVRAAFVEADPAAGDHFTSGRGDRCYADLRGLARQRLRALGVTEVSASRACTVSEPTRFFSHRRDGPCGRMATLIWLAA